MDKETSSATESTVTPSTPVTPTQNPVSTDSSPTTNTRVPRLSHRAHSILFTAFLLLVAGLIVGYFTLNKPTSPAEDYATNIMTAASKGNTEELVTLAKEQDAYAQKLLATAAEQVKGTFKVVERKQVGPDWYFLYELKDSPSVYARIGVNVSNGEKLSSLVFAGGLDDKLALLPASLPDPNQIVPPKQATDIYSSLACVEQKDYAFANTPQEEDFIVWSTTYEPLSTVANKSAIVFFKADTTEEESVLNAYDDIARFAIAANEKQWIIRLRTTYNAGTLQTIRGASDYEVAKMRGEKAKNQLRSRGIPEDRIIVEEPAITDLGYSEENESIFRKIEMVIDPTCSKR